MTSIISRIALAGAAAVALGGAADATVMSTQAQYISWADAFTNWTDRTGGTFSLFNNSDGTLMSVSVREVYNFTSTMKITNTGTEEASGTAGTRSGLTISAADAAQKTALASLLPLTYAYTDEISYDLTGGQVVQGLTSNKSYDSQYVTSTNAAVLSAFAANGPATGTILSSTKTFTNLGDDSGNVTEGQTTKANGGFYIYYTYDNATAITAVPEAATWAMMLVGFGGMGATLRRRRTTRVTFG